MCPSDLAPALMALGALISIAGPEGSREIPLDEFFVGPKVDPHRENTLAPNEIVTSLVLSGPKGKRISTFLKIRERQAWDFALASVAIVLSIEDGVIKDPGVVLGGVAPNPWRAVEAESMLNGVSPDAVDPAEVAAAVSAKARPLKGNRYKVDLAGNVVSRALTSLLQRPRQ